jgi:hypothetical protein
MYSNWHRIWEFGFQTRVLYNAPLNDQKIHCCVQRRQFTAAEMRSFAWRHYYHRGNEKMSDLSVVTSVTLFPSIFREGRGTSNFVPEVS